MASSTSSPTSAMSLECDAPCPVSEAIFNDLVHYFKYACSAYIPVCPRPNGQNLVLEFGNFITDIQGFIARDDERKEFVVALRGRWVGG
ncbi:unnamed protein product [Mycena citricolor]|uniref:Uncharacterized protein n=2 Tax=Mycena citricolor TaxID=2018698 RepID=A0AAD2H7S6_9AGAR|nr:unnamed protein product [Mycena citricolor]